MPLEFIVIASLTLTMHYAKEIIVDFKVYRAGLVGETQTYDLVRGTCPQCKHVHPECIDHNEGPFWTHFKCSDCSYEVTIHYATEKS